MNQTESLNQIQSISLALQGFGVGLLLIFPALLSLKVLGVVFGFLFLPVVAIYYWPRNASYFWSLFGVFSLGMIYDLIGAGPLGLWSLALLVLYIVLGAGASVQQGFVKSLLSFILSLIFVFFIVLIVGRLSMGQWPKIGTLIRNVLATIFIFPLLYWVRILALALRGNRDASGARL